MYLEKLVERARHVEVQILGDDHGNLVHLFERDCSVQRRNQKVVERAPAPYLDAAQRAELTEAALRIGHAAQLPLRRHGRIPDGCRYRQVLFHRGQSAHPGRAHRHRGGDRHRHRQGADPRHGRRGDRHAGIGRAAPGGHPPQRPRPAVPGDDRRSRKRTSSPITAASPPIAAPPASASASTAAPPIRARSSPAITIRCSKRSRPGRRPPRKRSAAWTARLREFRIRGVSTNLAFLENIIGHPEFPRQCLYDALHRHDAGAVRHRPAQGPGASKLLTYIADVTVNGHPEVRDRPRPPAEAAPPVVPDFADRPDRGRHPPDSRARRAPRALPTGSTAQQQVLFTDTTMRDAHQSLAGHAHAHL